MVTNRTVTLLHLDQRYTHKLQSCNTQSNLADIPLSGAQPHLMQSSSVPEADQLQCWNKQANMTREELSTKKSALPAESNLTNSTDHSAGTKNFEDHNIKTQAEIRYKQPQVAEYGLAIRQEPVIVEASEHEAGVTGKKNNSRKKSAHAIEPMPIVELVIGRDRVTNSSLNISPLLFLYARLLPADLSEDEKGLKNQLIGGHAASIFRYKKDKTIQENGFFIFQDLRVKFPGTYRIGFTLCEVVEDYTGLQYVLPCAHAHSQPFSVIKKGTALPEPKSPSMLVAHIEAGGAKLRYRKVQAKKTKKDENWGSSLSDLTEGKVGRVVKKGKRISIGSDDLKIDSVSAFPNFPSSMQGGPHQGMFQGPGPYQLVSSAPPTDTYHAMETSFNSAANFSVPQVPFTYTNQMPSLATTQPMFDATAYETRYNYPAAQFGEQMQTPQYPTASLPMIPSMQQSQSFQHHPTYFGGQMTEQARGMEGANYQNVPQYPPSTGTLFGTTSQPMHFGNPQFEQQYPPEHQQHHQQQQYPSDQQQQHPHPHQHPYPHPRGFYEG